MNGPRHVGDSSAGAQHAGLTYADVLRGRREAKGRRVREVWVEWAMEQPDPKPSWLAPFDDLTEPEKEVDRRIGSVLWGDGYMRGVESGLKAAYDLLPHPAKTDVSGVSAPYPPESALLAVMEALANGGSLEDEEDAAHAVFDALADAGWTVVREDHS